MLAHFISQNIKEGNRGDNILTENEKNRLLALSIYFLYKYIGSDNILIRYIDRNIFYHLAALPFDLEISYKKTDGSVNYRKATRCQWGLESVGVCLRGAGREYIRYYDLEQEDWRCFHPDSLLNATIFGISESLKKEVGNIEEAETEWLEEYRDLSEKYLEEYSSLLESKDDFFAEILYPIVLQVDTYLEDEQIPCYWFALSNEHEQIKNQKELENSQYCLLSQSEIKYFFCQWEIQEYLKTQRLIYIGAFDMPEKLTLLDNFRVLYDNELIWEHDCLARKFLKPIKY